MRNFFGQQKTPHSGKEGKHMNKLLVVSLLALSFATGFTCSKKAPEQAAPTEAAPAQTEMAAPAEGQAAPTEAAPTEAAPAAPTETK